jgi:diguanylate cyclase (GGDEF)-like protein/PAS domain S-box-containing protein
VSVDRFTKQYIYLTIVLGISVCVYAVLNFPIERLDLHYLLILFVTILVASRITIQIPFINGQITVSDTFIFLTMLLFNGEAAILLAAIETAYSSHRIYKTTITTLFNAAIMAISTFLTVCTLRWLFGSITALSESPFSLTMLSAIYIMALVQYVANSGLAAIYTAGHINRSIWHTWRTHYLWASITYLAGASAAGIIARIVNIYGFYAVVITVPIIAIIYITYQTYLRNVEMTAITAKAEQAERHVAELSRYIEALRESEERYALASMGANDGLWDWNLRSNRIYFSPRWKSMLGFKEHEIDDSIEEWFGRIHQDDLPHVRTAIEEHLKGGTSYFEKEYRMIDKNGRSIWILSRGLAVRDVEGRAYRMAGSHTDISLRKHVEEKLLHDAFHDALTGLPNRSLFVDRLERAIKHSKRHPEQLFAVLFLDIDRFKVVNDSLGHLVGDELLVEIGKRLSGCLRPGDTVARFGGDEFTILLDDIKTPSDAIRVANRIHESLAVPLKLNDQEVFTTASIGIALSSIEYDKPEDLLRDADTAMYRAKAMGRSRHEVFDAHMHAKAVARLQVETDLRHAIERGEFIAYYQPMITLQTGNICGFEALIRWNHPSRGIVSPVEFIPIAEETGMIIHIGKWILKEACRQMQVWREQFPSLNLQAMSVNLSGKQFLQPDLIQQINNILLETGLNGHALKLEITESILMDDIESATYMLAQLRELNVRLAIDDFGTGYSSLSYLYRLPINSLKIDKSFVSRMNLGGEHLEIVKTILSLAHNLRMDVIAEGVETVEQFTQLRALKCEHAQGYFFSRPVTREMATRMLEENLQRQKDQVFSASVGDIHGY